MVKKEKPYEMTVDLNVLKHLGINLYSNVAAALTEAVANAWDADAENVVVTVEKEKIIITDDGIGMTVEDVNDRYLKIGYARREEGGKHGKKTIKNRRVMGRKGLGKLSLFSIANVIEIQSIKDDKKHGFTMRVEGIEESIKNKEPYRPDPLGSGKVKVGKGTQIILKELNGKRHDLSVKALKKRLARRFSVIGEAQKFKVTVNNEKITPKDRGDLEKVEFLWTFGGFKAEKTSTPKLKESHSLDAHLKWLKKPDYKVKGWIGTAIKPKDLDADDEGNLNSIVVFARGRIFQENIFDKINSGSLYTKYVTGQIEADFLDDDNSEDIATSDRQRIKEDDPRYAALITFLKKCLNDIETQWSALRKKNAIEKIKKETPILTEWLKEFEGDRRESAEKLIESIRALPIEKEEDRKLLYKHGILAFERMLIHNSEREFSKGVADVEKLLELLGKGDDLEATLYCDITRNRLTAINAFENLVDANKIEKTLQKYLFNHLWLLDPAWERAAGSQRMEKRLKLKDGLRNNEEEKEKYGRVDIVYRTNAGKHIIVELKRAGRIMKLPELLEQGRKYVDAIKEIERERDIHNPNIEVVFVLGRQIDEERDNPDSVKHTMNAISPGSRIIHYEKLIQSAQGAYSEYLERQEKYDNIKKIVDKI